MANRVTQDDLMLKGRPGSTAARIRTSPEKNIEIEGPLNIVDSSSESASISINGIDLSNYSGTPTLTSTAITLSDQSFVIAKRLPGGGNNFTIQLPQITKTIKYNITFEGDLRTGAEGTNAYWIKVRSYINGNSGDTFDGRGKESGSDWIENYGIYTHHGSITIQSVVGLNPGIGTGNGWKIINSHFEKRESFKHAARVASVKHETLSSVVPGHTIDGSTLGVHERVLLKDQNDSSENGLYTVQSSGNPVRASDFHTDSYQAGSHVHVVEGDVNATKTFSVASSFLQSQVGTNDIEIKQANNKMGPQFSFGPETKIVPSDGAAGHGFGLYVHMSGDVLAIGSPYADSNTGAVYVYRWDDVSSEWGSESKILPAGMLSNEYFGWSVHVSGDTLAVGAYRESGGGSVYVYRWDSVNATWGSETKIVHSGLSSGDEFGIDVIVEEDLLIIGAGEDSEIDTDTGAVYTYMWNSTSGTWEFEDKLFAPDAVAGDKFGITIGYSNGTLIVDSRYRTESGVDSGALYVFQRNFVTDAWTYKTKLLPLNPASGDQFGWRCSSISGNTIVACARERDSQTGKAFVYEYNTNTSSWSSATELVADDLSAGDLYGTNTTVNGDTIVVAARDQSSDKGSVYVFRKNVSSGDWEFTKKIVASDGAAGDRFGSWTSISENRLAIGAFFADISGDDIGAVYTYDISQKAFEIHNFTGETVTSFEGNGLIRMKDTSTNAKSVSLKAPDRIANSYILELPTHSGSTDQVLTNNGLGGTRWEYVAKGSDTQIQFKSGNRLNGSTELTWSDSTLTITGKEEIVPKISIDTGTKTVASDAATGDAYGESVCIYDDIMVVGAPGEDAGGSNAGAAYIHKWTGSAWDTGTKIVADDAAAGDQFGRSISVSGNIVAVGAHLENSGAGAVYVFRWDSDTAAWDTGSKLVASDAQANDYFGNRVCISDDVLIVGAPKEDAGGADAGAAYIFRFNTGTGTWDAGTKIVASDAAAGDEFGWSVSISGDVAAVGAYKEGTGGSVYLFRWNGTTWTSEDKVTSVTISAGDDFGYSVSVSGDRVAIGAPGTDSSAGKAYMFKWNGSVWDAFGTTVIFSPSSLSAGDKFGYSVSLSGDTLAISSPFSDDDGSNAGAVYYYKWNGSVWGTETKFVSSDIAASDAFGYFVSAHGNRLAVGAYGDASFTGATYVFNLTTPSVKIQDSKGESVTSFENEGTLRMRETIGGTNSVSLKAPEYIPHPYSLTLPDTPGNPGQVATSDGSGRMKWADASGSSVDKGTVTQLTDINTAVTLNKRTGVIKLASGTIAAHDNESFTFNNSFIDTDSVILLSLQGLTNCNVVIGSIISSGSVPIIIGRADTTSSTIGSFAYVHFHIL